MRRLGEVESVNNIPGVAIVLSHNRIVVANETNQDKTK